jgi:rod shape-determining protein MreC
MPIFNFISQLRDVFVLAVCILFSLLLLIFNDEDPKMPFRTIAYNTVGAVGEILHDTGAYFRLTQKVKRLNKKNAELSLQNAQLQDALLENIRLRKMLEFKKRNSFELIPAEVIGQNPQGIINGFLLNQGSEKNILKDDAVVTAEGLVGKIAEVSGGFSTCQILLDRNCKVSAKIQRNRELGIISWDGASQLKLMYITKTIDVIEGDVIITSGYSQIYPENIKIGVVVNISHDNDDLFQDITVKPAVNFNQTEEVFIVKQTEINAETE